MYKQISEQTIKDLQAIVGKKNILLDEAKKAQYAYDECSIDWDYMPEVVVEPESTMEISQIMQLANQRKFPIYPRGAGAEETGGCVPVYGGAVLSLERMNKILEIDKENMMMVVEPGVTLRQIYTQTDPQDLSFPPHPENESACIGGLIANNVGGARAVKYGVIGDFVQSLEVVLPSGEIITLGGKIKKDTAGYDLLKLMIGSEGTLGIITKATLGLAVKAALSSTIIISYHSIADAMGKIPRMLLHNIIPITIEMIEKETITLAEKMIGLQWPLQDGNAYLMIGIEGDCEDEIKKSIKDIKRICFDTKTSEIAIFSDDENQRKIIDIRGAISDALMDVTIEGLDICIPISEVVHHINRVKEISAQYGMWLPTYGHAGDGNVHTHITKMYKDQEVIKLLQGEQWQKNYPEVRMLIHEDAIKRGGSIAGEHGIGLSKKDLLKKMYSPAFMELQKGIKRTFDPTNILNPGKIFDL